ncbi:hypothetical protein CRG98_037310, partial [Punica granatum]
SGFHTRSVALGFHTHTTAVRVSHPFRCTPGFTPAPPQSGFHTLSAAFGLHTHTPLFTPTPPQSGFHTRSATFGFHTHTAVVRVSHPLRCIRVSHPWFHTHTPGFTPTPPHLGFHTRSAAHRVSHPHHRSQGFTPAPLHSDFTPRVSRPHTGFQSHTTAVRVSCPLRCIGVSHPGFHTHTTAVRSGFHTRSAAFGFHTQGFTPTHRVSVPHYRSQGFMPASLHWGFTPRVSHPHTGFHTYTTAVRVSHPFHCTLGFTPTPPQSGLHARSAAFGFHTQGFTPTHR